MKIDKTELPAGEGQLIVFFVNRDFSGLIDMAVFGNEVAADAAERRKQGWRLNSVASTYLHEMRSGFGDYATQAALMAVYSLA